MFEADEAALEVEYDRDYKSNIALGSLLSSTRTEQMGNYGDWGRYEMGSCIRHFQRTLLTESVEPEGARKSFDDRIARRYVIGRVLELGLDKTSQDRLANLPYEGRSRPSVERLGKKYQWIAFYEILGYLTDHYHYCEWRYEEAKPFGTAVEFGLPDLLDPVLTEQSATSTRGDWPFAKSSPLWVTIPTPYPSVLSKSERFQAISATETQEPGPLLRPGGALGEWLALAGVWKWNEPVPCWVEGRHNSYGHASIEWHLRSYAVPTRRLSAFNLKMLGPVTDGGMIEDWPTMNDDLQALVAYPGINSPFETECADTFSKVKGACFAAAAFSARTEGTGAQSGIIPSPQLARIAGFQWTRHELNFSTPSASAPEFISLKDGRHRVTLMNAALLQNLFAKADLQLVWRLYGWKWSYSSSIDCAPQREYWVVYTLGKNGRPKRIGGGTWLVQPDPIPQELPW